MISAADPLRPESRFSTPNFTTTLAQSTTLVRLKKHFTRTLAQSTPIIFKITIITDLLV
jgi:hypothetical protein